MFEDRAAPPLQPPLRRQPTIPENSAPRIDTQYRSPAQYDSDNEYHSQYGHETPLTSEPSAAPNLHGIALPPYQHSRQQSAPIFSPGSFSLRSLSPVRKQSRPLSQDMPFTGDGRTPQRPENASPGRFAAWLGGPSTPSAEASGASPNITPKSKRTGNGNPTTPKSTPQSRFGFLTSSVSAFTNRLAYPQSPSIGMHPDDELYNLDIESALYPTSSPLEGDTFSPAAYKNLQTNATGLLHKMQNAYRQQSLALREIQAEREAQREETEETKARIELFKTQLEDMALKATKQEEALQQVMIELQSEKTARRKDHLLHEKVLAAAAADGSPTLAFPEADDDEDLTAGSRPMRRRRQQWRHSGETDISSIGETDRDSAETTESESVFSRSRSPTVVTTATADTEVGAPQGLGLGPIIEISAAAGDGDSKLSPAQSPNGSIALARSRSGRGGQQLTAFQKFVKGISGEAAGGGTGTTGANGCQNCRGQDSSVAWDTVSLLRDENKSMKYRVAELEVAVEGALDLVNGIGRINL